MLLTREAGKNAELHRRLAAEGIQAVEVPMVATAPGPDRQVLSLGMRMLELALAEAEAGLQAGAVAYTGPRTAVLGDHHLARGCCSLPGGLDRSRPPSGAPHPGSIDVWGPSAVG